MKISIQTARRIAIHAQLLDGRTKLPKGKAGIAQIIEKLGYLQIDTISVIERAHHHTLWTRRADYNMQMLHELQAKDRLIFEYWGHAASYLPMNDYRFYLPRMRRFLDPKNKWQKHRLEKYGHLMKPTMERIRKEGPLSSKDFLIPSDRKKGTWWDWRPAKVALELLFWRGELMITERRNFHRVYDLTERVLPASIDITYPTDDQLGRFLVNRALNSYGIATEREICDHIRSANRNMINKTLLSLLDSGVVIEVQINKREKEKYFALSKKIEKITKLRKKKPQVHILSPFDNLVIQRDRLKLLFDFDYTIECYLPSEKRKFGYFVLPILWGEEFIGRLDSKADRKEKTLIIRKLYIEDKLKDMDLFLSTFAQKLWQFASFNNCDQIVIKDTSPKLIKKEIKILSQEINFGIKKHPNLI